MPESQASLKLEFKESRDANCPRHPALWVKEIAVFADWNTEALVRRISLRRGLNVLWADPGNGGPSGHAAGKTVFCRLLRYLLGDGNFGKERFCDAFRHKFPKAWLVGEVHVAGEPWLVCRYLGIGSQRHWASEETVFDLAFDTDLEKVTHAEFIRRLNAACLSGVPSRSLSEEAKEFEWVHLLQWLARDQEARYANLAEWRNSLSESESHAVTLTKTDRSNLIRTVMGLLSTDEQAAIQNHTRLLSRQREVRDSLPKRVYATKRDRSRFCAEAEIDEDLPDDLFLQQASEVIKTRSAEVAALAKQTPQQKELETWGDKRQAVHDQLRDADRDLAAARARRKANDLKRQFLSQEISAEQYHEQMAKNPPAKGYCSASLEDAHAINCPLARDPTIDLKSARNLMDLEGQVGAVVEAISTADQSIKHLMQVQEKLRKEETAILAKMTALCTQTASVEQEILEKRIALAGLKTLFDNVRTAADEAEDLTEERDTLEKEIEKSNKAINELRKKSTQAKSDFSAIYDQVIQAMLTTDASGCIRFAGRDIIPEIELHGDLNSAAIETVKLLAFDLASLAYSGYGHGHHPRFLIHDSPREADLAANIYHRLFLVAEQLESLSDSPNFQYIVTTTEAPPESIQQGDQLLKPILNAAVAEQRLLCVDL